VRGSAPKKGEKNFQTDKKKESEKRKERKKKRGTAQKRERKKKSAERQIVETGLQGKENEQSS